MLFIERIERSRTEDEKVGVGRKHRTSIRQLKTPRRAKEVPDVVEMNKKQFIFFLDALNTTLWQSFDFIKELADIFPSFLSSSLSSTIQASLIVVSNYVRTEVQEKTFFIN